MANRHDVIIWDADIYGAPDGFSENTYQKAYALIKQPAEPSKKLLAFARDVEKYSQSNEVPPVVAQYFVGFEDDIKAEGMAAYCFNLPEYNWQHIVKILLQEAIKHGLALFDEQIILVLLPNGTILPENSRKSWLQILNAPKQKNAFPQTVAEFYTLVKTRIGALLAEHDFVVDRDELSEYGEEFYINYLRPITSGNHQISFDCRGGDGEFTLENYFQLVENTMIEIGMKSDFKFPMDGGGGVSFKISNILNPISRRFTINNWESFEEFLLTLQQSALRWSDAALDIKGIDALFNGDIDKRIKESLHRKWFMPYALIIARLANNPNFEDLAISLGQFGVGEKVWSATRTIPSVAWPKLVQYLRDEVKPLV